MSEQTNALETVRQALPVFQQINDLYLAADSIYQRTSLHDATSEGKVSNSKGKAFACTFATWMALDVLLYLLAAIFKTLPGFILVPYVIGTIICCIVVYRKVIHSAKQKVHNETDALIAQNKRDLDCISEDICEIYRNNEQIISQIPRDYRTYDAVSYFEHLLENGHAETMKEALILYDEYLHRQSMLVDNQRMIQQNIQQRQMLEQIEATTNSAARSANVAAAFSIATFLSINDRY